MDDASEERRLYGRLIEPLEEVRRRMCLAAPATRWHLAIAQRMIAEPAKAASTVRIDDAAELSAHLANVSQIASAIEEQERRCMAAWRDGRWEAEPADYASERDKLVAQFDRLCIRLQAYERVVRQPDKPLVREARDLIQRRGAEDPDAAAETSALENKLRMKLAPYLANEEAIAGLLATLDQARADVVQMHVYWAMDLAQTLQPPAASTRSSAIAARAMETPAKYIDYRRGYDFRTYAQHWVEKFVQREMGDSTPPRP